MRRPQYLRFYEKRGPSRTSRNLRRQRMSVRQVPSRKKLGLASDKLGIGKLPREGSSDFGISSAVQAARVWHSPEPQCVAHVKNRRSSETAAPGLNTIQAIAP